MLEEDDAAFQYVVEFLASGSSGHLKLFLQDAGELRQMVVFDGIGRMDEAIAVSRNAGIVLGGLEKCALQGAKQGEDFSALVDALNLQALGVGC
jgi:hypothetical protein